MKRPRNSAYPWVVLDGWGQLVSAYPTWRAALDAALTQASLYNYRVTVRRDR